MLVEGRLTVLQVNDAGIVARCKGDSGDEHMLGWDAEHSSWHCTCEGNSKYGRTCAHLRALWLVTVKQTTTGPAPTRGGKP